MVGRVLGYVNSSCLSAEMPAIGSDEQVDETRSAKAMVVRAFSARFPRYGFAVREDSEKIRFRTLTVIMKVDWFDWSSLDGVAELD